MNLKPSRESKSFLRSTPLLAFSLTLCVTQIGLAQSTRQPILTAREIAQKAAASVVMVVVQDSNGKPMSQGSGFFVKDDLIATSLHVVKDAKLIKVKLAGQRDFYVVQEIAEQDKLRDLALLRVSGMPAKPLPLSNGAQVAVGDDVFVHGNPEGLEGTFSQGIVSARRESAQGGKEFIQITAPVSPGSSGAPVMNNRGEVIGVVAGLIEKGQNLNFAIPEVYLRLLLSPPTPLVTTIYGDPQYHKYIPKERRADEPIRPPESSADSPKNSTDSWFDKGKAYTAQGRYLEAVEAFKQAIKQHPDDWRYHLSLGIAYSFLERRQEAISSYKQAIKINPDEWRIHLSLGIAYNSLKRYEEALNAYKQALRLNTDNADLHVNLGKTYARLERHRESVAALKQAIKIDPLNAEAFFNLGMTYHDLDQWQEAIAAYKQAVRLDPDLADAHHLLGYAYLRVGDVNSALEQYKILKRLDKSLAEELFKAIYK